MDGSPNPNPSPQPGSPLPDRFELGELLGRGAMADVYAAQDRTLDRPVAVKLFRIDPDGVTRHRFHDEARALARLSHHGLVSVFDVGEHDGRPFLVMQQVAGQSLLERLLTGPMSPTETRRMGIVLAEALAHVHERGVVHRDVKPSNILLEEDGTPHLGDFGIALLAGSARMTNTNEIIGTPAYLAPEQVLGEEIGPPVDVYALGLVLLECLTGDSEYIGGSEVETAVARLHRSPHIPPELPHDLVGLLTAMTANDPSQRPTAAQCARHLDPIGLSTTRLPALAVIAPLLTTGTHTATTAVPAQRAAVPVWRPLAAAAAGVAALATGLVLTLGSPSPVAGGQQPPAADNVPVTQSSTSTTPPSTTTTAPPTAVQEAPVVSHRGRGTGGGRGRGGGGSSGGGSSDGGGGSGSSGGSSGGGGGSSGDGSNGGGGGSSGGGGGSSGGSGGD
jgi:serine/threonine protein kinase